jgi:hypothetical protein
MCQTGVDSSDKLRKKKGLNPFDPPCGLTSLFFAPCGSFRIVNDTSFMAKDENGTSV